MVELVLLTGPAIAVEDVETPGMLKEELVVIVLILDNTMLDDAVLDNTVLDDTMLGVAWSKLEDAEATSSQVATQYAFPANIFEHIGGTTAGFHPIKVSTAMPNWSATLLQ